MIVVSNAGPLIALARIDHLALIQGLYGNVLIPRAVEQEVVGMGFNRPGAREISTATWIQVADVSDSIAVSLLRERLDAGESAAIVLALEQQADLLLMDEARGRRMAQSKNLAHTGTVGILVLAKRQGLLNAVTPALDQLITTGFRMNDDLRETAQKLAGES
ncbi:MAG: DUF3368 domain-containing protein [Spirulina sp.]